MKLIINVVLVFLLSVHIAVASEEQAPDRDQTITYINKIMQRLADKHIGYLILDKYGTFELFMGSEQEPLEYDNGSYSFKRRQISGPLKQGRMEVWAARYSKSFDIPIKSIGRFSRKDEAEEGKTTYLSTIKTICIHFDVPYRGEWQTIAETSRYGGYRMSGVDEVAPKEEMRSELCVIYPAEDPNNFTRLQNAFLRLKEIESEVRDPFLD